MCTNYVSEDASNFVWTVFDGAGTLSKSGAGTLSKSGEPSLTGDWELGSSHAHACMEPTANPGAAHQVRASCPTCLMHPCPSVSSAGAPGAPGLHDAMKNSLDFDGPEPKNIRSWTKNIWMRC
jgi:hypothetical protein